MANVPRFHIALLEPEIAPNTGNIGRLCLGVGARLHLIHPLGFDVDEKAVRRAGLDYWKHVDLQQHNNLADFLVWAEGRRVWALSTKAGVPYTQTTFTQGDVLLFGRETAGLPEAVREQFPGLCVPMPGQVRSLNLSNAVAIVAYRALQQIEPNLF